MPLVDFLGAFLVSLAYGYAFEFPGRWETFCVLTLGTGDYGEDVTVRFQRVCLESVFP